MGTQSLNHIGLNNIQAIFDDRITGIAERMDTFTKYMVGKDIDINSAIVNVRLFSIAMYRNCNLTECELDNLLSRINQIKY